MGDDGESSDDNRHQADVDISDLTLWELLPDCPPWWTEIERPEL